MNIGYARVSTEDQNPDLQLAALKKVGCERIFIEKAMGTHVKRTELTRCLKALAAGDTLIVWKLDRLGRSLRDLIALLDDLKARGVAFGSLTEAIDTTTPTGRAMWQMVGILAELERSLNSGAHPSGPRGGGRPWGQDGPQTQTIAATGRPCPQVHRARRTSRHGSPIAQRVAADTVSSVAGLTVTMLYRTGPVHGMWFER